MSCAFRMALKEGTPTGGNLSRTQIRSERTIKEVPGCRDLEFREEVTGKDSNL